MQDVKTRGRKPDANSKSGQIRQLLASGMASGDIAKKVGCSPNLVYAVKAKTGGGGASKRGRPAKNRAGQPMAAADGLATILTAVKSSEQQRIQLRGALERIQSVIAAVLT